MTGLEIRDFLLKLIFVRFIFTTLKFSLSMHNIGNNSASFFVYFVKSLAWAQEHCRTRPPRVLAECRKRRLNQASFVLLCFVLFDFSGLCLVSVLSVFTICVLSCIFQRVPT